MARAFALICTDLHVFTSILPTLISHKSSQAFSTKAKAFVDTAAIQV